MRKIREVLRLRWEQGLSQRQIVASCKIGQGTVVEYLRRAAVAGLTWPLPEGLTDAELDRKLFPPPVAVPPEERPLPDWAQVHRELRKKGVTLLLLWEEYRAGNPQAFRYSWFCERYHEWRQAAEPRMHQVHKAGEKLFVDYAGLTVPVVDRATGEARAAQIFVATWGASSYTYAEATWSQTLPDWIGSHARAFAHFGGVPELVVPDNLKAGVTAACYYEPDLNPTYQELARYYGTAIVPARVRKPRDKGKVENGVQQVERWVLAPLRHRTFFTLAELNAALWEQLRALNDRPGQGLPASRRELFETLEQPALRPLPARPYELALWKKARVHLDYHVQVDFHFYSVPSRLVREEVEVRLTGSIVELFHGGERVASHARSRRKYGYTTLPEHMPPGHRAYADRDAERLLHRAREYGAATEELFVQILGSRQHPEQGYRSCLGILRLGELHGAARLERAWLATRLKRAQLRQAAAPEDVDFRHPRGLDRSQFLALCSCEWLKSRDNLLITGPTGAGKTFLACALAQKACREGYSVAYARTGALLRELTLAHVDGTYVKRLAALARTDLLVLDDWGLSPLTDGQRRDLWEVLDDRYDRRSTLVTSQFPVGSWHETLGDPTLADAILDRLVHNAHKLSLQGESLRKQRAATP